MRSSRTARKIIGAVGAAAVSALLLAGTAGAVTHHDAGRGITNPTPSLGRGI